MSEENKALYKRFIDEVINKQNMAALEDMIAPGGHGGLHLRGL